MNIIKTNVGDFIQWGAFEKAIGYLHGKDYVDLVSDISNEYNWNSFIVGGFVRDFLIGRGGRDIDIVIEGNAIEVGRIISRDRNVIFSEYDTFLTGTLKIDNHLHIDLVTARREYYKTPGSLPKIIQATLYDDLFRRDFTINGIGVQINGSKKGRIIDYFGGLKDLGERKIRILHNLSFMDDPTRILRAIKFEQRFDFMIEENTMNLLVKGIEKGFLHTLSHDRTKNEIFSILKENESHKYVKRLLELKVLQSIYPYVVFDPGIPAGLNELENDRGNFKGLAVDFYLVKFLILFSKCPSTEIEELRNQLSLNKLYGYSLERMIKYKEEIAWILISKPLDDYQLFKFLQEFNLEVIVCFYFIFRDEPLRKKVLYYLLCLSKIKLQISGNDLIKLGIQPGKVHGNILQQVLKEKMNVGLINYQEEIEYAIKIMKREKLTFK